jgi:hypothetical protein
MNDLLMLAGLVCIGCIAIAVAAILRQPNQTVNNTVNHIYQETPFDEDDDGDDDPGDCDREEWKGQWSNYRNN